MSLLARKWRPQRFEDVIGQRGVVDTLKNAIASGRLAQSFIFAGPRGVGKTTTARILARALNCVKGPTAEPCGKCDACTEIADGRDMDVLEDRRRHLHRRRSPCARSSSSRSRIAPMRDRYKIFIIDEVHRLSKQAFDALLKSIEEPPPYVKFMMATTDLHAVPATIQSRSQVFELKTLPFAAIRDQLKHGHHAREGEDGRRGAGAGGAVGRRQHARRAVGARPDAGVHERCGDGRRRQHRARTASAATRSSRSRKSSRAKTPPRVFDAAGSVVEAGFDLRIVCRELARLMRDLLVVKIDATRLYDPEIAAEGERDRLKALADSYSREDLMRAFDLLSRAEYEIRRSSQPRHQFEMTLVEWIHLRKLTPLTESDWRGTESGAKAAGTGRFRAPRPQATEAQSRSVPARRSSPAASAAGLGGAKHQAPSFKHPGLRPPSLDGSSGRLQCVCEGRAPRRIRDGNKMLYSMVVAQAQKVELTRRCAGVHVRAAAQVAASGSSRQARWIEQLAQTVTGRQIRPSRRTASARRPPAGGAESTAPPDAARPRESRADRAGGAGRLRRRDRHRRRDQNDIDDEIWDRDP